MKLLLCQDGTETAERAAQLGSLLAAACHARVTLLAPGGAEAAGTAGLEAALDRARTGLEALRVPHATHRPAIPFEQAVIQATESAAYDLVVLGGARRDENGELVLAQARYELIQELRPPVLVVTGPVAKVERILLCTTGTGQLDHAIELSARLARGLGARLTLLHVVPKPPALYVPTDRREAEVAAVPHADTALGRELRRQRDLAVRHGAAVEIRIRDGLVAPEILAEIQNGGHDLVVTGSSRSHGTLRTYVLGDLTREILAQVEGALLVVRLTPAGAGTASLRTWLERVTQRPPE